MPDALDAPESYSNRELSWLSFNERVLGLAERSDLPLLERLKFVAIAHSNLDEFYMVRIGGLERELQRGSRAFEPGPDGLSVAEVHERAHRSARALGARLGDLYMDVLRPALASEGVVLATRDALDGELAEVAERFYRREVHPVLTPLAIDRAHPFPMLRSGSVNLALLVEAHPNGKGTAVRTGRMSHPGTLFALVQVPAVLPRFIALSPGEGRDRMYVALEDIVARHVADVFPGHHIREAAAFRITRSSDLDFVEEEADDLLATIRDELRRRDLGEPVRLEIEAGASEELTRELMSRLELGDSHLHRCRGPVAGKDLMRVFGEVQRADLKDPTFNPLPAPRLRYAASIFRAIAERDILLHHPYESFRHVVDFIEQAAEDPDVVAIKQTLYRTSGDSPIVRALTQAAEQGKDVTALVELKARFDEANNIAWARRLEESGVHVVYGLIGLKTHSKMLLVTRREGDQLKRYLHLGTGNYHPSTARLYTDLGLFTAREDMTHDAMILFNVLTGYAELPEMKQLVVAPFTLRQHILDRIDGEIRHAKAGRPSGIIAKMNSLVDGEIIRALYRASQAGVKIDLVIRGICCLRPGIPGVSENIRVRSILDRFLEHSRIFVWTHGGDQRLYLSSADWMPRNLNRRIECCFPVLDPQLRERILETLTIELADNTFAWDLEADGTYTPVAPHGSTPRRAQRDLIDLTKVRSKSEQASVRPELHKASRAAISPVMRVLEAQRRRQA